MENDLDGWSAERQTKKREVPAGKMIEARFTAMVYGRTMKEHHSR